MSDGTVGKVGLRRSIFIRTYGLIVLLVVGVWAASSMFVINDQRQDEMRQAKVMAAFLADQLNKPGLWDHPEAAESLLGEITKSHFAFDYIFLEGRDRPALSTFPEGVPEGLVNLHPEVPPSGSVKSYRGADGRVVYDAAVPVGTVGWNVHVGVGRGAFEEYVRKTLQAIAVSCGLALVAGLGLAWAVSVLTTREVGRSEAALRESEERYHRLFDQAPDSIMLMEFVEGQSPIIFEANEATCRIHGMTRDEVIGAPISKLDVPKDRELVMERVRRIMNDEAVFFEAEHLRGDGSTFPVEVIARKIELGGRPVIQAIDRDVSDRKRAEEEKRALEAQLVQAQKMEAIGRLAGGIAHDMNNVLGAVMGAASLLEEEIEPGTAQRASVDNILAASRRGRDITRNFLGYARKGRFVKEEICLNDLVAETTELLSHTISKKIAIEIDLEPDIGCIEGDRGLVNQAIMNLAINAVDAIGEQGTLRVSTEIVTIDDPVGLGLDGIEPGAFSKVTVADTGVGMDEETLRQAFEPFFTTKPSTQGTGLGLSMVYGTMKSHDGTATIDSVPGEGTTITLLFPLGEPVVPSSPRPADEPTAEPKKGSGLVLLVDDEKLLRFVGQQMLVRLGYTVLAARDGVEAVEIYHRKMAEIALVILDLVMPRMDGPETFRELQKLDPEVKVLISSGFTSDETVEELLENGALGFIEKPFDKESLGRSVARVLE